MNPRRSSANALIFILPALFWASSPACAASAPEGLDNDTCLACHESDLLAASVHGTLNCVDCHSAVAETPHAERIARVQCGACHIKELGQYAASVHGKAAATGKRDAPSCVDCHGEHGIRSPSDPKSAVYTTTVSEKTCGHCHGAERIASKYHLPPDRVSTYLDSYHGLASRFGKTTVANCASCHSAHEILPSSDPRSSVNKANLPTTCGQCHPNVSSQLAKGFVHVSGDRDRDFAVFWITVFYIALIILVIGGMLVHNALDFARKFREIYRFRHQQAVGEDRFTPAERLQHHLLIATFTVLAYSGFALKFPDAWWAAPFTFLDWGFDLRGVTHRVSAVAFTLLAIGHGYLLLMTPRGRGQLKALALRPRDFKDLVGTVAYNLELRKDRPKFGRYSYIEKSEYWALLWGSLIMISTGALLAFENLAMRFFPKWVMDVATAIHFYEAVLATLAIVIWHFYFTIFDPEHYPLNQSIFSGRNTERRDGQDEDESP